MDLPVEALQSTAITAREEVIRAALTVAGTRATLGIAVEAEGDSPYPPDIEEKQLADLDAAIGTYVVAVQEVLNQEEASDGEA